MFGPPGSPYSWNVPVGCHLGGAVASGRRGCKGGLGWQAPCFRAPLCSPQWDSDVKLAQGASPGENQRRAVVEAQGMQSHMGSEGSSEEELALRAGQTGSAGLQGPEGKQLPQSPQLRSGLRRGEVCAATGFAGRGCGETRLSGDSSAF